MRNSKKYNLEKGNRYSAKIGKYSVQAKDFADGFNRYVKITLTGKNILPIPLEIAKTSPDFHGRNPGESLRLETADFPAINASLGRVVLGKPIRDGIAFLEYHCSGFSIFDDRITALVPFTETSMAVVKEVGDEMASLAGSLARARATADIRLHAVHHLLRYGSSERVRYAALAALLKFYPDHTWTRGLLEETAARPEFELAYQAAEALGRDLEAFTYSRAETSDVENRIKAIQRIGLEKCKAGLEFLIAHYIEDDPAPVRLEVLNAIKQYEDRQAEPLLLRTLQEGGRELREAAADALAACGGESALAALYAVSQDRLLSRSLRGRAAAAGDAIRRRLGLKESEAGRLSLAENDGESGGLSLADQAPDGGLSRAEKPEDND